MTFCVSLWCIYYPLQPRKVVGLVLVVAQIAEEAPRESVDFSGVGEGIRGFGCENSCDPAPWNHSTSIAVADP